MRFLILRGRDFSGIKLNQYKCVLEKFFEARLLVLIGPV